jgi:hypothetical protein
VSAHSGPTEQFDWRGNESETVKSTRLTRVAPAAVTPSFSTGYHPFSIDHLTLAPLAPSAAEAVVDASTNGPLEADKPTSEVRQEPYALPAGFEWVT